MKLDKSRKYKESGDVFQWSPNVDVWFEINGRRAYCHELFQEFADGGNVEAVPVEFTLEIRSEGYTSINGMIVLNGWPAHLADKTFKCVEVQR